MTNTTLRIKNLDEPQVYDTYAEALEAFLAEHPEVLDDDIAEQFDMWCERYEVVVREMDDEVAEKLKASEGQY